MTELAALIFADDLSGGNATAALCARAGRPAATLFDPALLDNSPAAVVIADLETRTAGGAGPVERALATWLRRAGPLPPLTGLRIDSTLRGNWGFEMAALLGRRDAPELAVIVPAYPAAGRRCEGSFVTVNGVPLNEATQGLPGAPTTASVPEILTRQFGLTGTPVMVGEVRAGASALAERCRALHAAGSRVLVVDATEDSDCAIVADAIRRLPLHVLPVDPGPVLSRLVPPGDPPEPSGPAGAPLLICAGTMSDLAAAEVAAVQSDRDARLIEFDPSDLAGSDAAVRVAARQVAAALGVADAVILRPKPGPRIAGRQVAIDRAFGQVARRVAVSAGRPPRGLILTGGSTALAVARGLGARGLLIEREVRPLVARGSLLGGTSSGLPAVTKGGLVPGLTAAVTDLLGV